MKPTWKNIHKEIIKPTNEDNIKSLRINNHVIYNQISISKELNNYFLKIAGSRNNNRIYEKEEVASPLQYFMFMVPCIIIYSMK